MAFIERWFAQDPTDRRAPNHAAICALLRAAGSRIEGHPGHEMCLCRSDLTVPVWPRDEAEFQAATGRPFRAP